MLERLTRELFKHA
jgi:hypothetical protein